MHCVQTYDAGAAALVAAHALTLTDLIVDPQGRVRPPLPPQPPLPQLRSLTAPDTLVCAAWAAQYVRARAYNGAPLSSLESTLSGC